MGWSGRKLSAGLAVLSLALAASAADPGPVTTPPEAPPTPARPPVEPEDLALLRELELLEDLELLRGWDPQEDLPIPVGETEP